MNGYFSKKIKLLFSSTKKMLRYYEFLRDKRVGKGTKNQFPTWFEVFLLDETAKKTTNNLFTRKLHSHAPYIGCPYPLFTKKIFFILTTILADKKFDTVDILTWHQIRWNLLNFILKKWPPYWLMQFMQGFDSTWLDLLTWLNSALFPDSTRLDFLDPTRLLTRMQKPIESEPWFIVLWWNFILPQSLIYF